MALFYRGAPLGSYWHSRDARISGFSAHKPGGSPSPATAIQHIANGTTSSCYVSLTASAGVARDYALNYSRLTGPTPTAATPAYDYTIDLTLGTPALVDPVSLVAAPAAGAPIGLLYHHNGGQDLMGIISAGLPVSTAAPVWSPAGSSIVRPPVVHDELLALVNALRDSEILAVSVIAAACVISRDDGGSIRMCVI
jgi:hypothetical protein